MNCNLRFLIKILMIVWGFLIFFWRAVVMYCSMIWIFCYQLNHVRETDQVDALLYCEHLKTQLQSLENFNEIYSRQVVFSVFSGWVQDVFKNKKIVTHIFLPLLIDLFDWFIWIFHCFHYFFINTYN